MTILSRAVGPVTAFLVLVVSLGLLGPSPASADAPTDRDATTTTTTSSTSSASARYVIEPFRLRADDDPRLARAWRLWQDADLRRYTTRVERSCFCPPSRPILTEVVGRRVVSKTYRGGEREIRGHGYEMEQLFRLLRKAYAGADSVRVRYGARGVPLSIAIDRDELIADEEQYLTVRMRS